MRSLQLSPQQAAKELLRRRRARSNLVDFARYTNRAYIPADHHHQICAKLEAVARGEIKRLMIFMPPRHGKTELASRRFPAWFLGQYPERSIIAASYNSELAGDFGREVRNIVSSPEYAKLFDVGLAEDSQAAGRWHTNHDGGYVAAGVGTAITGRGAHILLIDDPFKDRESADSEIIREKTYKWYLSTAYTRLEGTITEQDSDELWRDGTEAAQLGKPFEGAVVIIQCMTGDTPVLMATGHEKPLRDVRPGDLVATYNNGALDVSTVKNWASNGADFVYEIKTTSGKIVKANERHPFLVLDDGELKWIRTKNLRLGHEIVRVNGESGRVKLVCGMAAKIKSSAGDIAHRITTKKDGQTELGRHRSIAYRGVRRILSTVTGLLSKNMISFMPRRAGIVRSAGSHQGKTSAPTGAASYASITAMARERLEPFFAMTAILLSGMRKQLRLPLPQQSTCDFTLDRIAEIKPAGQEEVFDVQIEGTENFIANGLVSHNTRWHEDDLAGRLLEDAKHGADQWDVLSLPAIDHKGGALWPGKYPIDRLQAIKRALTVRDWEALYQQQPKPDEGTFFQRAWFKRFHLGDEPKALNKYQSSDYAVSEGEGDFTEHGIWGLDKEGDLWAVDWWYGQESTDTWIDKMLDQVRSQEPFASFGEVGVIRKAVEPFIKMRSKARQIYPRLEWISRTGDKPAMARAFQGMASMGKVHIPHGEWGDRLIEQLVGFPSGKHDDAVDVCALIGMAISQTHPAIIPVAPDAPAKDLWGRFNRGDDDSWKTA